MRPPRTPGSLSHRAQLAEILRRSTPCHAQIGVYFGYRAQIPLSAPATTEGIYNPKSAYWECIWWFLHRNVFSRLLEWPPDRHPIVPLRKFPDYVGDYTPSSRRIRQSWRIPLLAPSCVRSGFFKQSSVSSAYEITSMAGKPYEDSRTPYEKERDGAHPRTPITMEGRIGATSAESMTGGV